MINVPAGTYSVAGGLNTSQGQVADTDHDRRRGRELDRHHAAPSPASRHARAHDQRHRDVRRHRRDDPGRQRRQRRAGGNVSVSAGTLTLTRVRVTGGTARQRRRDRDRRASASTQRQPRPEPRRREHRDGPQRHAGNGGGVYVSGATSSRACGDHRLDDLGNHGVAGAGIEADTNGSVDARRRDARAQHRQRRADRRRHPHRQRRQRDDPGLDHRREHRRASAGCRSRRPTTARSRTPRPIRAATSTAATTAASRRARRSTRTPSSSTALDTAQQPPVLTIPADSPARRHRVVRDARLLDQRGVARPQGCAATRAPTSTRRPSSSRPPRRRRRRPPSRRRPRRPRRPRPTPVFNKTVVVEPVSGTVKIKVPGSQELRPPRREPRACRSARPSTPVTARSS